MALGGGIFVTENKLLPGSYINVVSSSSGTISFSGRGTGALLMQSDWGIDGIIEVTRDSFLTNSTAVLGYDYTSDKLKEIRDFFCKGEKLYFAPLCTGGARASNDYATATHWGTRGNSINIVIEKETDGSFTVSAYMDSTLFDEQNVKSAAELTDNELVVFNKDAELTAVSGARLTGGACSAYDGAALQTALGWLENYDFDCVGLIDTDETLQKLVIAWTKRMRDEVGIKFSCVAFGEGLKPDYEGVINIAEKAQNGNTAGLVAWTCGAAASAQINESLTNIVYDGSLLTSVSHTQGELEEYIKEGIFAFHRVGSDIRVLSDISSLVNTDESKGEIFKDNQTVRICDQIATDIATIFNTSYLGRVPNDAAGRSAFKSDIVRHHNKLLTLRAIEEFSSEDISVERGESKHSVIVTDCIQIANTMTQLYMTVRVE